MKAYVSVPSTHYLRRIGAVILLLTLAVLAPQAAAVGTTAGTNITNQAYADYEDANGNPLTRVLSNTVTTTVSQVGSTRVEPPAASKTGVISSDVYYAVTIHNDGNGSDTFSLAAVSVPGWVTTIYNDDNGDGIWDPGTETTVITDTGALAADAVKSVIVVTTVPGTAISDDQSTVTLTATSQFDNAELDTAVLVTTVLAATLEITKTASPANPQPGDEIIYAITGKNTGTATALNVIAVDQIPANTTYVAESTRVGPIGGDYATAAPYTDADDAPDPAYFDVGANQIVLTWGDEDPFPPEGSGSGGVFYFKVTVDADVASGTGIDNSATASFQLLPAGTTYTFTSNDASVVVSDVAGISLTPASTVASGDPGDVITYAITVTNDGNTTDTIDVTLVSGAGWTWDLWYDANDDGIAGNDGDFLLTDTDGDGIVDTGDIPQGGSAAILATTTVPAGTADGTADVLVVTGTSSVDTGISNTTGDLTTTVTAPVLSITKSVSPAGSQPPGTELTYTVTVSNTGSGTATNVVITDLRPTFTTYVSPSIRTGSSLATLTLRSDASDGDGGEYDPGSHSVIAGGSGTAVGSTGTFILEFKVTID